MGNYCRQKSLTGGTSQMFLPQEIEIIWLCFTLMEGDQNFINTKGFTVLALVDYDYKFIYIDVGCQDRISDGGVFNNSTSKEAILNNSFSLPPPKPLPILEETDIVWIMILQYILSRVWRIFENY